MDQSRSARDSVNDAAVPLTEEEYRDLIEAAIAYLVLKHHKGVFTVAQDEWEKVAGGSVGGSLNLSFQDSVLTITVSRSSNAKA